MDSDKKILYVVHCVDTEGPLEEGLDATFQRLKSMFGVELEHTKENLSLVQQKKIDLGGNEEAAAKCFAPSLLKYNANWSEVDQMLDELLSKEFRRRFLDDFGGEWIYSWHCMDQIGYRDNPRCKDIGYGKIFNFYKSKLLESQSKQDEINWHFHPLSLTRSSIHSATSYVNSYDVLIQILCRRIIDEHWFPVVNRPGFHSERPDSHAFMEQWIPFDYANQVCDDMQDQPDLSFGRFGDWSRAPRSWRGYHPSHDDYQIPGACRRIIFRCLNIGSRHRFLTPKHVKEAFLEARSSGAAILSFSNHDYRDMRPDISQACQMLRDVKEEFPDVFIKYAGAEDAARSMLGYKEKIHPRLNMQLVGNRVIVEVLEGEIFGPQPFLAIKSKAGNYYHDNFDVIEPKMKWAYVFDDQTIVLSDVEKIGVGTAGRFGRCQVELIDLGGEVIK